MNPPVTHKHDSPPPGEKKSTAEHKAKLDAPAPAAAAEPAQAEVTPHWKPTPPGGFTALRTITVTVYGAAGKAPMFYVAEGGSYNQYFGSERAVAEDVRNRLHPPWAAAN